MSTEHEAPRTGRYIWNTKSVFLSSSLRMNKHPCVQDDVHVAWDGYLDVKTCKAALDGRLRGDGGET